MEKEKRFIKLWSIFFLLNVYIKDKFHIINNSSLRAHFPTIYDFPFHRKIYDFLNRLVDYIKNLHNIINEETIIVYN